MIFKVLTLHTKMLSMVYHLVMMIKTSKNIDKLNSDLNHAFDDKNGYQNKDKNNLQKDNKRCQN